MLLMTSCSCQLSPGASAPVLFQQGGKNQSTLGVGLCISLTLARSVKLCMLHRPLDIGHCPWCPPFGERGGWINVAPIPVSEQAFAFSRTPFDSSETMTRYGVHAEADRASGPRQTCMYTILV